LAVADSLLLLLLLLLLLCFYGKCSINARCGGTLQPH
jgi:hypothetical protein